MGRVPRATRISKLKTNKKSIEHKKQKALEKSIKVKNARVVPKKSEIIDIIVIEQQTAVFRDDFGRLYGFITDDTIVEALAVSADGVDGVTKHAMWVWLPTEASGRFAPKVTRGGGEAPLPIHIMAGDDLIMPDYLEEIFITDYRTEEKIGIFKVLDFLGSPRPKSRIEGIIMEGSM